MILSLRARLLAGYIALVVVVGGATMYVIERSVADQLEGELDDRLVAQAREVSRWLAQHGDPKKLAPRLARVVAAHVTIIAADGTITGDSIDDSYVGKPVGLAPEVSEARTTGVGRASRELAPGGVTMYLVAIGDDAGGAVRVAVPLTSVRARERIVRNRLLIASAIGLAIAILLGLAVIRAVTRPLQDMTRVAERLARGDYEAAVARPGGDELALLSRTLAMLAGEVKTRIAELTRERDLSANVVDALVEGVVAVDREGKVVLANRAATALIGDAPFAAPLAKLVDDARGGADRDAEIDLGGRVVRVAARPLAAAGGAVAVLYDVTQLRALEGVRREFLASAAHELRTPVTAISGYAETLLGGGVDDASAKEFLGTIHRNAARITRLVEDLLELERLEQRPERVVERVAVPLAPIAQHAAASARAAAAARGQPEPEIAIDIAGDLHVRGDQDGLEHVVQNLVDNAVVHGGGAVKLSARRDARRVILSVADRGGGIPPEHLARVFERFYRVDPARSRSRGGSGLGLAIVREHVAAMGGEIRVESEPGQGATFVVELDAA